MRLVNAQDQVSFVGAPPQRTIPICAEWRCSCRGEIELCCARLLCAVSQAGADSHARLPPAPFQQARERAARTHGWVAAAHPRAPWIADRSNSHTRSAATCRSSCGQTTGSRLLFPANLLRFAAIRLILATDSLDTLGGFGAFRAPEA
jgi:hypothetical protein